MKRPASRITELAAEGATALRSALETNPNWHRDNLSGNIGVLQAAIERFDMIAEISRTMDARSGKNERAAPAT